MEDILDIYNNKIDDMLSKINGKKSKPLAALGLFLAPFGIACGTMILINQIIFNSGSFITFLQFYFSEFMGVMGYFLTHKGLNGNWA